MWHDETGTHGPNLTVSQFDSPGHHAHFTGGFGVVSFITFLEGFGKNFGTEAIILPKKTYSYPNLDEFYDTNPAQWEREPILYSPTKKNLCNGAEVLWKIIRHYRFRNDELSGLFASRTGITNRFARIA